MKEKKLISVTDYAKKKGLTVQAIYKQVKENRVKSVKVGKVILIEDEL
jgi:hypothetical protein